MDIIETLAHTTGLISGPRLARLLGYDKKTIARMAREKRIPHLIVGGRVRFNPQVVAVWLLASQMEVK